MVLNLEVGVLGFRVLEIIVYGFRVSRFSMLGLEFKVLGF